MDVVVPGRPTAPTLQSVAALAGVSRATASRVLNGSDRVSDAARASVQDAVARLSYVPNAAARSLVRRRSDSIAFVVAEDEERFFSDPFFAAALRGAHGVLAGRGMQLVFVVVASAADRDQLARFATSGHVDGAILVSTHGDDPMPRLLTQAGVPVVLSGRPYRGDDDTLFVDADNTGGARQAAEVLLARGRSRLVTIAGPSDMPASRDRLAGFRAVLAEHGADLPDALVVEGDFTVEGGRQAMRVLLERCPDLDGVFAANDLMGVGAVQALVASGRAVPEDVALVGFDDVSIAAGASPALTTIRQPIEEMGRSMARMLLDVLDGRDHESSLVLPTRLVRRDSC